MGLPTMESLLLEALFVSWIFFGSHLFFFVRLGILTANGSEGILVILQRS
jgi:hypothetical protein